jgi:hypothetical protein
VNWPKRISDAAGQLGSSTESTDAKTDANAYRVRRQKNMHVPALARMAESIPSRSLCRQQYSHQLHW